MVRGKKIVKEIVLNSEPEQEIIIKEEEKQEEKPIEAPLPNEPPPLQPPPPPEPVPVVPIVPVDQAPAKPKRKRAVRPPKPKTPKTPTINGRKTDEEIRREIVRELKIRKEVEREFEEERAHELKQRQFHKKSKQQPVYKYSDTDSLMSMESEEEDYYERQYPQTPNPREKVPRPLKEADEMYRMIFNNN